MNGRTRGLAVQRVAFCGGDGKIEPLAGPPSFRGTYDRPGTITTGHSRPLDAWTVRSLTLSVSPTRPASSPNSSVSAALR